MRIAIILLAMTLLICPVANASQIVEYNSEILELETDWNSMLQIPQFDPSMGDLSSVMVFVSAGYQGLIEIVNNEDIDGEYTWVTSFDMYMELPDAAFASSLTLLSDSYFESGWVVAGETVEFPVGQEIFDLQILEGEALETFIGTGTIDLPVWTDTFSHLQIYFLDGTIDFAASAWASLTVTYIYDGDTPAREDSWTSIKALY